MPLSSGLLVDWVLPINLAWLHLALFGRLDGRMPDLFGSIVGKRSTFISRCSESFQYSDGEPWICGTTVLGASGKRVRTAIQRLFRHVGCVNNDKFSTTNDVYLWLQNLLWDGKCSGQCENKTITKATFYLSGDSDSCTLGCHLLSPDGAVRGSRCGSRDGSLRSSLPLFSHNSAIFRSTCVDLFHSRLSTSGAGNFPKTRSRLPVSTTTQNRTDCLLHLYSEHGSKLSKKTLFCHKFIAKLLKNNLII